MGYPIEFVPLHNPYETKVNDKFQVQLLWKGKPLAEQLVYAGNEETSHSHGDESDHSHEAIQYRTDKEGIVTLDISIPGQWYLRTILMQESDEPGLTHESNWTTLTFAIPGEANLGHNMHVHKDGTTHSHDSFGSSGIYKYLILGVLLLLLGLWIMKARKSNAEK